MKLVDIIGESMDKLVDNKMINKIEKLLQEARTHVAVEVNNTLLKNLPENLVKVFHVPIFGI